MSSHHGGGLLFAFACCHDAKIDDDLARQVPSAGPAATPS
jgi:hypothetical protein